MGPCVSRRGRRAARSLKEALRRPSSYADQERALFTLESALHRYGFQPEDLPADAPERLKEMLRPARQTH